MKKYGVMFFFALILRVLRRVRHSLGEVMNLLAVAKAMADCACRSLGEGWLKDQSALFFNKFRFNSYSPLVLSVFVPKNVSKDGKNNKSISLESDITETMKLKNEIRKNDIFTSSFDTFLGTKTLRTSGEVGKRKVSGFQCKAIRFTVLILTILFIHMDILAYNVKPPRLTVVIVIDQFAHHYIDKLYPHLKHGLRYLIDHGVNYTNAHYPSGQPGTACGHANLNTGVTADYHGFVSNGWIEDGEKVACDDDDSADSSVFSPDGTYDYGKSAHRLMVDGISDQCVLQTEPRSAFFAYSISGKSRSAIATAGRLAKPLWIDTKTGHFTSSKAYFDTLPEWVQDFNNDKSIDELGSITWKKMYPTSPYAYQFFDINNYDYTRAQETMMNRPLAVPDQANPKNPYHMFEKTPQANQYILDCSLECIKKHVSRKHKDRLFLWVCLSPLDKVAHQYGSNSMEAIDMVYHLDKQIQRFMRKTLRVIGKHELIFALTADHGVMPIPELLQEKGLTQARRIERAEFIKRINNVINQKHSLDTIVESYKGQELVLDMSAMEKLDSAKQHAIIDDIKLCVLQEPGIKNVWTYDELIHLPTQPHTLEDNIKHQLFKSRIGSIIVQPYPYTVITHWSQGAAHKTPYNYDTHVPLIIFHPGKFEKRFVRQRVTPLQLPNTLAEVLNIPKPSASVCEILPELFDPEYK